MDKRISDSEYEAIRGRLTPEERQRLEEEDAQFERERRFPDNDPPRVTVRYHRTSPWDADQADVWGTSEEESFEPPSSELPHEELRQAFYDAMYDLASDRTIGSALDELAQLADGLDYREHAKRVKTTNRYGLDDEPESMALAAWIDQHGLGGIPNVGSDVIGSIRAYQRDRWLGNGKPFRLCVHPPAGLPPGTAPRGYRPHTPGQPREGTLVDPDSIDITINGSWRTNARTHSLARVVEEVLDELKPLLTEQLGPIFDEAKRLHAAPKRRRNTSRDMRWLLLCHFPDDQRTDRTPREYVWRERELRTAEGTGDWDSETNFDTADRAVRELAKLLGLDLARTPGKPRRIKERSW